MLNMAVWRIVPLQPWKAHDERETRIRDDFFHVALLAIIVLLVDERLMRGALAILPAMLLAQRAMAMGASQVKDNGDWTGIDDRRMDQHVREHVEKLLAHFREFYAMHHLMSSGRMTSEEALVRAGDIEKDLNRLLDDVTAGPQKEPDIPQAAIAATPVEPELSTT